MQLLNRDCYVITYYDQGPCYVNVGAVVSIAPHPVSGSVLTFKDGSTLKIVDTVDQWPDKARECTDHPDGPDQPRPNDLPVFPGG